MPESQNLSATAPEIGNESQIADAAGEDLEVDTPAWVMPAGERRLLIGMVWIAGLIFACGMTVADPDLWGHTLYGLRSMDLGVWLEKVDPFSYTAAGYSWINHEWLTEYQYGMLWRYGGNVGLWMWRNAMAAIVFICAALAIKREHARVGAAAVLLIMGAECLSEFFVFIRPQLATLALFAVSLTILRTYWDRPHRGIWCLPFLTALWVNLHGGFLAGLGIHGLFVIAYLARVYRERNLWRYGVEMAVVGLLSVAATLANPYGITMHSMLWDHLMPEQKVREWAALWEVKQAPTFYLPFIIMGLSLPAWKKWAWIDVLILGVISQQAVSHIRHIGLLTIAVMILLPGPLSESLPCLFRNLSSQLSGSEKSRLRLGGICVIVTLLMLVQVRTNWEMWEYGLTPWEVAVEARRDVPGVPLKAIAIMENEGLSGKLVTDYGWGQYALWHLFPDTQVAFDGRYRTVYPADVEQEFMAFQRAHKEQAVSTPMLDKYDTEIALLPTNGGPNAYLQTRKDWALVFADEQFGLYVRDVPKFKATIERCRRGALEVTEFARWQRFPAGPISDHSSKFSASRPSAKGQLTKISRDIPEGA